MGKLTDAGTDTSKAKLCDCPNSFSSIKVQNFFNKSSMLDLERTELILFTGSMLNLNKVWVRDIYTVMYILLFHIVT